MPTRDDVPGLPWELLADRVAVECSCQCRPPVLLDPEVLARVAALLGPVPSAGG